MAGIELGKIFPQMVGTVRISDPYMDEKTLDIIYKHFIDKNLMIRILTAQVKNQVRLEREIEKIKIEGVDIEVRKISAGVMHDRYFIDDKHFWLSGNSLNNLGNKESFIVMLGNKEVRQTML